MEGVVASFAGTPRFQVLRRIGEGGGGVVYEALDRERGGHVALKTLTRLDPAALYRLKKEFRALADVSHRNLVELHELVSEHGECFFTMELVRGVDLVTYVRRTVEQVAYAPTLDAHAPTDFARAAATPDPPAIPRRLDASGTVDLARLRSALRQLAEGLDALHAAGKLHRDIKPSNVLVTQVGAHDERVVILDFGIATDIRSVEARVTEAGAWIGTPAYMAPEQAVTATLTEAADWYAVGVVLFEALTGRLPFVGQALQVLNDKNRFEPPRVGELVPDVPPDLEALCADLLRIDPAARPSGGEVLRRLGVDTSSRSPRTTPSLSRPSLELVGRADALARLAEAFEATSAGRGVRVHVQGRSGVGKTALVRRFLDDLAARGDALVLSGRCYERESVPYKAFDAIVDALTHHLLKMSADESSSLAPRDAPILARVFPVMQRLPWNARAQRRGLDIPDAQQLRARAFVALRELLARIGDRRPLVLFIDDLQWGDADSIALLAALTAPPDAPIMLVVLGYRAEDIDRSPTLRAALELRMGEIEQDVRTLALEALDTKDAMLLARSLLGGEGEIDATLARRVAEESAGNPFFVGELVRYVQSRPMRASTAGLRLEGMLRDRFADLSDEAMRLLNVVCVAARPLPQAVLLDAARLDGNRGRQAFASLRVAHFVRAGGDGQDHLEPYHDRIREIVVGMLDDETTRRVHGELERALLAVDHPDPDLLFLHSRGAGLNAVAAKHAQAAAEKAAAALAFDRAAQFYRFAIDLTDAPDEVHALHERLGDAYANAGRSAEATDAYLVATRGASAANQLELRRRAAEQLLFGGHIDRGLELVQAVLSSVGLGLAQKRWRSLVALLFLRLWIFVRGTRFRERDLTAVAATTLKRIDVCWSVACGLGVVDNIRGAEFGARLLIESLRAGEPWRVSRALAVEAMYVGSQGAQFQRAGRRLIGLARDVGARVRRQPPSAETGDADAIAHWATAWIAYFAGKWREARSHFEEGIRIYRDRCTGTRFELDTLQCFHLFTLQCLGDLPTFARLHPNLLREAEERGDRYLATNLRASSTNLWWVMRDDAETARAVVVDAVERWSRKGFQVQHWWEVQALTRLQLYQGNYEGILERIERSWGALRASFLLRVQLVRAETLFFRASASLAAASERRGERARLLRIADRDARALCNEGVPWIDGYGWLLRGGIEAARGEQERARHAYERSLAALEASEMVTYAAVCRRRLGELVAGDEGKALVHAANEALAAAGVANPSAWSAMLAPKRAR